ncbi:hypothetical protein [Streptomyces sp. AC495_CC817]|uniref:hypothetical protein n=1 Tax=Streptomyces sp. AC495_CC817 TaxID=2823900 RepID=UPI001C26581F|nr:hypothetical protein [Streptomyces sp. AC495_CC817]
MSRGRIPSGLRRLGRQPLRAGAVVLLAATTVAAAGAQHTASVILQSTIDENWRGTYDILVTASDDLAALDGALPPNALAGSGAGLGIDDWERIQALDGVGVAAPIGEILVPSLSSDTARLLIPREVAKASTEPQAYRLTVTYATDDGLGERIIDRSEVPLIVDGREDPYNDPQEIEDCKNNTTGYGWNSETTFDIDRYRYPDLMEDICNSAISRAIRAATLVDGAEWSLSPAMPGTDVIPFRLPTAPRPVTRITLVDPQAERELLGERGAFLDPLVSVEDAAQQDVDAVLDWAEQSGSEYSARITDSLAQLLDIQTSGMTPEAAADLQRLMADNGADLDTRIRELSFRSGIVPLLVSDAEIAPLTLKVEIEHVGTTLRADSGYELLPGTAPEVVGTSVGDVSGLLNPFTAGNESLNWPGADQRLAGDDVWNVLQLGAIGRSEPSSYAMSPEGPVLEPSGYTSAMRREFDATDPLALAAEPLAGGEAAYTDPRLMREYEEGRRTAALPIGSFDPAVLGADVAVNHVPLGAYAPVDSRVVDGEHQGVMMRPGPSGLGLVSARTVAIAPIGSAELWNDEAPISSIRVRVAGVDHYGPEGRERVLDVAREIEDAGYTATIVAGSSPRETDVLVDGYLFGSTDPVASPQVGSLGAVAQKWSELGAASRVELATTTTAWTMLGIALGTGLLLLAAAQFAAIPARRGQAVVLREIGFARARIVRWFAAEELPALAVVAVIAAAAWALSGFAPYAGIAAGVSVAVLSVSSVLAVGASAAAPPPRVRSARSRRLGARSVWGFGLRQAAVHPLTSLVHIAAIVIVGVASAALAETLISGRTLAGTTGLALLVNTQLLLPQLALGAVGVVGGLLLSRLIRRLDLERRAEQWAVLRAAGWTARQLAAAQFAEGILIVAPALALSAAAALGAGVLLGWAGGPAPVLAALAAGVVSASITFITRRRGGTA